MCYSCGRDLTNKCSDRLNMLSHSCAKILPVWEKLLSERFSELGTSINVQNIISDGSFTGKMCRSCVSALSRFQKLELSIRKNIEDAADAILDNNCCQSPCRKRNLIDHDEKRTNNFSLLILQNKSKLRSYTSSNIIDRSSTVGHFT